MSIGSSDDPHSDALAGLAHLHLRGAGHSHRMKRHKATPTGRSLRDALTMCALRARSVERQVFVCQRLGMRAAGGCGTMRASRAERRRDEVGWERRVSGLNVSLHLLSNSSIARFGHSSRVKYLCYEGCVSGPRCCRSSSNSRSSPASFSFASNSCLSSKHCSRTSFSAYVRFHQHDSSLCKSRSAPSRSCRRARIQARVRSSRHRTVRDATVPDVEAVVSSVVCF